MLFIPYDEKEKPKIVTNRKEFDACANAKTDLEGYAISPELSLLYHGYYNRNPNPHLTKFGVDIPGACLIIKEVYCSHAIHPKHCSACQIQTFLLCLKEKKICLLNDLKKLLFTLIQEVYDEEEGSFEDVPDNLYEQLGPIFEADKKARDNFLKNSIASNIQIIHI
jgi:hypothetical protein